MKPRGLLEEFLQSPNTDEKVILKITKVKFKMTNLPAAPGLVELP